jgi:4-hydroxy-tetrahydrodipicolinate reductase
MTIKVAIFGANGRLGRSISKLVADPWDPNPDVYIDASLSPGVPNHLEIALKADRPIVIGVTGLPEKTHALMSEAANAIPVFYAPNFSLGIALFRKFAAALGASFHEEADIDLIETHHVQKRDAPSGTALALAAAVGKKVNIHSIRSGQIVGKHELIFNTAEEQISIVHTSHSRDLFARGALAAARFLLTQPPGLYGMEHLLKN